MWTNRLLIKRFWIKKNFLIRSIVNSWQIMKILTLFTEMISCITKTKRIKNLARFFSLNLDFFFQERSFFLLFFFKFRWKKFKRFLCGIEISNSVVSNPNGKKLNYVRRSQMNTQLLRFWWSFKFPMGKNSNNGLYTSSFQIPTGKI